MNIDRRLTLVLASAFASQIAGAFSGRKVVEAAEVCAFFAPCHASHLTQGTVLNVHSQDGVEYLVFNGDFVGRLPSGFSATSASVACLQLDQDGRMRMYVQVF